MGEVLLRRLCVAGLRQGQPLCASAHGAVVEPEKPAVLPTEILIDLLRRTPASGAVASAMGGLSASVEMKICAFRN